MILDDYESDDETNEAHERRITRCRSCRAKIIFLRTAAGKPIPVDADTVEAKDEDFDPERHMTHFRTCTNADQHRRRR